MKVVIHRDGRNLMGHKKYLVVTSDATFVSVTVGPEGHVGSYSGSIWPSELEGIFEKGFMRPEIMEHFRHTVSPLTLREKIS